MTSRLDAVVDHATTASIPFLVGALVLGVLNQSLRALAWHGLLAAAHPGRHVGRRGVWSASILGSAVAVVAPSHSGDLVRACAVRRRVKDTCLPTIAGTLLPLAAIDAVVVAGLGVYAWRSGGLGPLPDLVDGGSAGPRLALLAGLAAVLVAVGRHPAVRGRTVALARGLRVGLAGVGCPRRFAVRVVVPQLLGQACRVVSTLLMLHAFGVAVGVGVAAAVLVAGSLASIVGVTPGGAGPREALVVLVLAGHASNATLLAYAVGAHVTAGALSLVLGGLVLLLPPVARVLRAFLHPVPLPPPLPARPS